GTAEEMIQTGPLYAIDRDTAVAHLTSLYVPPLPRRSDVSALAEAVATLRGPGGCPWDQKQTPQTLRTGLLEETAEVLDALDRDDPDNLREELGDLLLNILMQTQLATEDGLFTLSDVVGDIYAKIVRRHPHVWGEVDAADETAVLANWEAIKAEEKPQKIGPISLLENIPTALPALAYSQKMQKRVRKVGFDWTDIAGVYAKLQEEVAEVQAAQTDHERQAELGDLLFITVNLAHWLGVDAEIALREANLRFGRRFRLVEQMAQERNLTLPDMDEASLTALWHEAKVKLAAVEQNG
ncbi:MAG: nucleoside triphosphate pyrophosphohydrolase, partial [Anaerolineales bacterium]|nr:nucleoside triphosphate pyrophosphohydrolase [Anaerolineales bacterium]